MTIAEIILISMAAALVLFMNLRFVYIKKTYVKVNAVCISVNYRSDSDNNCFQPVWQYDYDDTTYISSKDSWSAVRYEIGNKTELYVCPKKPQRIYTGSVVSVVVCDVIVLLAILIEAILISL